jgi:hypothetical protein
MKKLVFLFAVLLLLVGCTQKSCFDDNKNSVCDSEEQNKISNEAPEMKNYVYYGDENGSALIDALAETGKPFNFYLWVKNSGAEERCKVLRHEGDFTFLDRDYEQLGPSQNKMRLISVIPPGYTVANKTIRNRDYMIINDKEVICTSGNTTANYTPSFKLRFWGLYDEYGDWQPNLVMLDKGEKEEYENEDLSLNFKLLDVQLDKCQLELNNQTFWMGKKETKDFGEFILVLGRMYSYSECDFVVVKK